MLLLCNKQPEAALRGQRETKLLRFHSLVFCLAAVDTREGLFAPSVLIFPACPVTGLLPAAPYCHLLPLTTLPSSVLPSSSSLIPFSLYSDTPLHINSNSDTTPIFLSSVFHLRIWFSSSMGLAPLWSWKVYPVTHTALSCGIQTLFPLHFHVLFQMQDTDYFSIFLYFWIPEELNHKVRKFWIFINFQSTVL